MVDNDNHNLVALLNQIDRAGSAEGRARTGAGCPDAVQTITGGTDGRLCRWPVILAPMPEPALRIRPATADDLPTITAIYNTAGVGTTASYDLAPVEQAHVRLDQALVAERQGQVIGYAAYGPFRPKAGYDLSVEHSVYVDASGRGTGAGRALLQALIEHARASGKHVMIGAVDAENQASIRFHERLGFEASGRLDQVGRKFGRWLDVVFMTLVLNPDQDPGAYQPEAPDSGAPESGITGLGADGQA